MQLPKVSVIVCTYNQAHFVRETLDSVLAQTYANIEIIVTDDGSSDGTPDILQEYERLHPGKLIAILHARNTGIPANINRGIARRTGDYTAWLDGDDLMLPTKIEVQVQFLQSHPKITGCYHDVDVFDSATGQSLGRMSELYNGTSHLKQGRLNDWVRPRYYFLPSAILVQSDACPPHGFDERLKHFSEGLFFMEVFRTGILLAIPDVLVRYRRHTANVSTNESARNLSLEYELLAYTILEARYPDVYPIVRRQRRACLLTEAFKCYREGNRPRGNQIIRNVMRDTPAGFIKGLVVFVGLQFVRQGVNRLMSNLPYQRPSWINRLARSILQ